MSLMTRQRSGEEVEYAKCDISTKKVYILINLVVDFMSTFVIIISLFTFKASLWGKEKCPFLDL